MEIAVKIMQVVIALGIFNVWLLRSSIATNYRGGDAKNLREEFAAYGLPHWFMILIGTLKLSCAVALLVGLWLPVVTRPAAVTMAALMLGAVAMHVKVKDPPSKTVPASVMLALSIAVAVL